MSEQPYKQLTRVIAYISEDNDGCTADEFEHLLDGCSDEMLRTLAMGEDAEQAAVHAELVNKAVRDGYPQGFAENLVRLLDEFLNRAFDA